MSFKSPFSKPPSNRTGSVFFFFFRSQSSIYTRPPHPNKSGSGFVCHKSRSSYARKPVRTPYLEEIPFENIFFANMGGFVEIVFTSKPHRATGASVECHAYSTSPSHRYCPYLHPNWQITQTTPDAHQNLLSAKFSFALSEGND